MGQIDWQEWERVRALYRQSSEAFWRDMGEKVMATRKARAMWGYYDDTQDQLAALWESQAREAWGDDYFDRPGEPPDEDEEENFPEMRDGHPQDD